MTFFHGIYTYEFKIRGIKWRNIFTANNEGNLYYLNSLDQWFPTGVPRHTRVPQRGVMGAAKLWIIAFY